MSKKVRNIEQIRAKADVHSTLEYLGIDTEGQKMICCPLPQHEDHTPSFSIYENDKKWQCHGACGTGGDSIRLVQLYKGVSWNEAVQEVGNLVGIQPEFSNMSKSELAEMQSKSKIEKVLEKLNGYFRENLWSTISADCDKARDYLFDERLINKELASIYEIGYAPWDYTEFLISLVENNDITLEELINFKLLGSKDIDNPTRTNVYCTLKNRITIPVIESGRIVGIIGRDIDENAILKYMKVGCTDYWDGILWQSGEQLEGYLEGDILHIIEGQFDAITVKQCGIDNIWSVNGVNSLTPRVVDLIKKMNPDRVYVHLDWDSTGEKAETQWAEKLGYKCYIMPPVDVQADNEGKEIKDVNRLFTFLYEQEKSNGNDDEIAFKNAVGIVRRNLEERIKQAKNLITLEFEKWRDIGKDDLESVKDDIKNIQGLIKDKKREIKDIEKKIRDGEALDDELEELEEDLNTLEEEFLEVDEKLKDMEGEVNKLKGSKLQSLLELAYSQYEGNAQLLELFKKDLMIQGVTSKVFESMIKDIIKGSSLIPAQRRQGLEIAEWEVIDGVLCKYVFDIRDGEIKPIVVSTTPPTIKNALRNLTSGSIELELTFTNIYGVETTVVSDRSNFAIKSNIVKLLSSEGFHISEPSAQDIIHYIQYLEVSEEINLKTLIDVTGYYNDETYIGRKGEIITVDGLIEDSNIVYKKSNLDNNLQEIKEINLEKWKELNRNVLPLLIDLNEKRVSLAIIGWYLASVMKEPIYNYNKQKAFPILNIFGVRGTGKTTIASIMQKLLGGGNDIKTAKITPFSLMTNLASTNAYPLILDEYKIGDLGDYRNSGLLNTLKIAYNSNVDQRGNKDKTITDYRLSSPVCVIGENSFSGDSSDAVKDRSAIVALSRSWLEKNRNDRAIKIESNNLDDFLGGYLVFILKLLESKRFYEIYDIAQERAYRFTEENLESLSDRNRLTLEILSFGVEILRELFINAEMEFPIIEEDIIEMFKHSLNHALNIEEVENSLDRAMQYVSVSLIREFGDNEILADFDEGLLYIKGTKLLTLLENHRHQGKVDIPEKSGIRQYLKESIDSGGYVLSTDRNKKINGKSVWCIVFDMEKLEKVAKIDKSTWDRFDDYVDKVNETVLPRSVRKIKEENEELKTKVEELRLIK